MNSSNPYESTSTEHESNSWRPLDYFALGLWLVIPSGLLVGRMFLPPVFMDFGVDLSATTEYLLSLYAPIPFVIVWLSVLATLSFAPGGRLRNRFINIAALAGLVIGTFCLLKLLAPLFALWQNLN